MKFNEYVKQQRIKYFKNLEKFCKIIGVEKSMWRMIERGINPPPKRTLLKKYAHLQKHVIAPVWHMNLSIEWLLEIADNYPRFCFGSSGQYWQVGSESWCRRSEQAWNELLKRGHRPWVHMMRGLSLCGDKYPFASAASTNVARNFKNKGAEVCPERMARRIDSVQNPLKWTIKEIQTDFFGG